MSKIDENFTAKELLTDLDALLGDFIQIARAAYDVEILDKAESLKFMAVMEKVIKAMIEESRNQGIE